MFSKETYTQRRAVLKQTVGSGLLLFLGNDEQGLNYADNCFRFRQDSTFLYYFGLSFANLSAVINIDDDEELIFGDELSIDAIVWMGTQPTLREKSQSVGISKTMPAASLAGYLQKAAAKGQKIHFLPPYRDEHRIKLLHLTGLAFGQQEASVPFIRAVVAQRNIKTAEEIVEIERACDISADMHNAAIRMVRPGMKEAEVVGALESIAISAGGDLSFPIIATINGQTLHNHYHGHTVKSGQLFLLDAGAETAMGYAGDLSSTFPVDKTFTTRQREIYDIQVAMHQASVAALKPGVPFMEVYELSARVMVDHLKSLGLMKGNTDDAVREGAHAMFFPCGLGHMMGLDVHDMENLGEVWVGYDGKPKSTQFGRKSLRLARPLEPGFVLTVEPGVYFIPELMDLWRSEKKFTDFLCYDKMEAYKDFGGIRNEEDFLITDNGARRLGKHVPITADEVESYR